MAISYFGKNGPITIRELIDEYSSDTTVLIFLIQQEPYEISEADKTQSIIANNKEPSIDNTPRAITYCKDCCRKKHLKPGNPPKSNCPDGYPPPIAPTWRPDYKYYPQPTTSPPNYPEYPYCCDPQKTPPYIPPSGLHRHNDPSSWNSSSTVDSKYVRAMKDCLKRKNVNSNPLTEEDKVKVQECLNEIKVMWETKRAKDQLCEQENTKIKACIAACMAATTDGVLPAVASGCGEKPSTQTN